MNGLFLLVFYLVTASPPTKPGQLPCNIPACYLTAKPAKPHRVQIKQALDFSIHGFMFSLPRDIRGIDALPGGLTRIRYRQCFIGFTWVDYRQKNARWMKNQFEHSGISINRYPEIMFEKTPKDTLPRKNAARWIWRAALHEKSVMLRNSNRAYRYRLGKFTIYHAPVRVFGYRGYTLIKHSDTPGGYIYVLDTCKDGRFRNAMLFSIKTK